MSLIADFGRALGQMGDRRFLRALLLSLAITIAALALVFWAVMVGLGAVLPATVTLPWVGEIGFVDDLLSWAAVGLMLALSVVLMTPVAAGVVGFFLDGVAGAVEAKHYPGLPPVAPIVFLLLNGFLLGREYFQLVAARRLGTERAKALGKAHFWRVWLAGTLMAVPLTVPVLNLLVPIFGVAVFTHQYHRLSPVN